MQQYKNFYKFRSNFWSFIKNFPDVIEIDMLEGRDQNCQKYAYVHVKDYSDDPQLFRKIVKQIYSYFENYSFVYFKSERKVLFWIPEYCVEFLEENDVIYRMTNENCYC